MDSRFSFPLMLVVIVNLIRAAAAAAAAAADEASMAAGETQIRSDLVGGSCTMDSEFAERIAVVQGFPEMRCFRCAADSTPSGGPLAGSGSGAAEPNLPVMYCTRGRCQPSLPPRWDDEAGELCGPRREPPIIHLSKMLREMNRTGIKRVVFEHFETVIMPVYGGLLPALGDSSLSFSNVGHFQFLDYLFSRLQEIEVRGILTLTDSEIRMTNVTADFVPLLPMGGNGGSVSAERSSFVIFPGCPHHHELLKLENDSEEIRYPNMTAYMSNITELKGCRQGGRIRVEMLDLNEVNIGTIPEGAFRRTSVGKMRITNSSIGTIEQGSFDGVSLGHSLQFLGNRVSKLGGNVFRHLGNSDTQPAENVTVTMLCNSFNISEVSSFDVERDGRVRLELDGNDVRIDCKCDDLRKFQQVPEGTWRPAIIEFQCTKDTTQHISKARTQTFTPLSAFCSSCGKFKGPSLADLSCSVTDRHMTCNFQQKQPSADEGVASDQQSFLLTLLVEQATSCGMPFLIIEDARELTINSSVLSSAASAGHRIHLKLVRVQRLTILELPNDPPCCKKIEFTDIRYLQVGQGSVTQHHTKEQLGVGSTDDSGNGTVNYLSLSSEDKRLEAICCEREAEIAFEGNLERVQKLLDQCSLHCQTGRNDEKEGQAMHCHPITGEAGTDSIGDDEVWICKLQNEKGIGDNALISSLEIPSASKHVSRVVIAVNNTTVNRMTIGTNALAKLTTDRLEFDSIADLRLEDGSLVTATSSATTVIRNSVVTKFGNVYGLGEDQVRGKIWPGFGGKPSLHFENVKVTALIPSSIFSRTETFQAKKSFFSGFGDPNTSAEYRETGRSLTSEQNVDEFNTSGERLQQTISIQESNISNIYQLGIVAEKVRTFEILDSEIDFADMQGILLTTAQNFIFGRNRFGELLPAAIRAEVANKTHIENNTFKSSKARFAFGLETRRMEVVRSNIVGGSSTDADCMCDLLDYDDYGDRNYEAEFGFPLRAFNLNLSCRNPLSRRRKAGPVWIGAENFYRAYCTDSSNFPYGFVLPALILILLAILLGVAVVIWRRRRHPANPSKREDVDVSGKRVTPQSSKAEPLATIINDGNGREAADFEQGYDMVLANSARDPDGSGSTRMLVAKSPSRSPEVCPILERPVDDGEYIELPPHQRLPSEPIQSSSLLPTDEAEHLRQTEALKEPIFAEIRERPDNTDFNRAYAEIAEHVHSEPFENNPRASESRQPRGGLTSPPAHSAGQEVSGLEQQGYPVPHISVAAVKYHNLQEVLEDI